MLQKIVSEQRAAAAMVFASQVRVDAAELRAQRNDRIDDLLSRIKAEKAAEPEAPRPAVEIPEDLL